MGVRVDQGGKGMLGKVLWEEIERREGWISCVMLEEREGFSKGAAGDGGGRRESRIGAAWAADAMKAAEQWFSAE